MTTISWTNKASINVEELDKQHEKLVELVNHVYDLDKTIGKGDVLDKAFDDLIEYTNSHFTREEELMDHYRHPEHLTHKKNHQELLQKLIEIRDMYYKGNKDIITGLALIFNSWLMDHLYSDDKKLGEYLNSKGIT